MSYNKYVKYKILKMKINQRLTNDEMIVERLPYGDDVVGPPKQKPKSNGTPKWFKPFGKLLEDILKTLQEHGQRLSAIDIKIDKIDKRIDNLVKVNNLRE